MKWFVVMLAGCLVSGASSARADGMMGDGAYWGISYASVHFTQTGLQKEINPSALVARYGRSVVSERISVEGRFGVGLASGHSSEVSNGVPIDYSLSVKQAFGIYARGVFPVSDRVGLSGLLGFTRGTTDSTASAQGSSESGSRSESGLSVGAGLDFNLKDDVTFHVGYVNYISKTDFDYSATEVGLVFALE